MGPEHILGWYLGHTKWALVSCYRVNGELRWYWADLGNANTTRAGFLSEDEAHKDARANGYEVEVWSEKEFQR